MTTSSKTIPHPFHVLSKPAGAACNLACEYCFYLDKDKLYPGSRLRMTDEVLNAYINQLLTSQPIPEVSVAWQGGEPTLMGLDFFKRSVDLVKKYKRPSQQVNYTLQTNGTLLDDEWCTFFKKNSFLVGLSCDGPAEMHDAYRVDKGGQGSFKQVKRGWDLLQKHGVETNILCAVHAANSHHPLNVYRFFRDNLQARFIQFIPVVERVFPRTRLQAKMDALKPEGREQRLHLIEPINVSPRSVNPKQYGKFLIDIFDEWVQHDVGTMFVQMFDSSLASWYGLPASVCVFQETCGRSLVLEHNGDIYSCDHFVEPSHRLGNILEKPMPDLVNSLNQRNFGLNKHEELPTTCRECDVGFACQGECPRNRFPKPPDYNERLNFLCEGYRLFFRHVDRPMQKMAELLRNGKSATEIMG
ncbi:MAG: anaerobic sulfatase maturase [Anaerolineales bacterium]|jgi:uncharacterized protein